MEIDICAREVDEIDAGNAVTLSLSGGVTLRIEGAFELAGPTAGSATVDPENLADDLELGRMLVGRGVEAATADEASGLLSIAFAGGLVVTVRSHPDYEAWSATWSDGSMLIALPGGGLSSWGARS